MSPLQRFQSIFNQIDANHLHLLDQIYTADVVFVDPFARVEGLPALRDHFASMYDGVIACRFEFLNELESNGKACLEWRMHFRHPRLRGGAEISVPGASVLTIDERASYHRDYFDGGALVYEHVPVIGRAVRYLRTRMGSS